VIVSKVSQMFTSHGVEADGTTSIPSPRSMQKQAEAAHPGSGIGWDDVQTEVAQSNDQRRLRGPVESDAPCATVSAPGIDRHRSSAVVMSVRVGRETQFVPMFPVPSAHRLTVASWAVTGADSPVATHSRTGRMRTQVRAGLERMSTS
jgi:hypothetical protein